MPARELFLDGIRDRDGVRLQEGVGNLDIAVLVADVPFVDGDGVAQLLEVDAVMLLEVYAVADGVGLVFRLGYFDGDVLGCSTCADDEYRQEDDNEVLNCIHR